MPKTEIQTLTAKISADYIRENGFDPSRQTINDVPDSGLDFYWRTTAVVDNVYAARNVRVAEQRIVRKPTATFPATVVCKHTRQSWHIFDGPMEPMDSIKLRAIARLRQPKTAAPAA